MQIAFAESSFSVIEKHQLNRLTSPSNYQITKERLGKVYIYVGIKDKDVDSAMDLHFDRIQNFIFTSVVRTNHNGSPLRDNKGFILVESDDC